MVKLTPTYSGFEVSWKDMDDTTSYNLYYKEVGASEYTKIPDISKPSYSLKGLKAAQEYEIYITGNNKKGEGEGSNSVKGKTLKAEATITTMPSTARVGFHIGFLVFFFSDSSILFIIAL